MIIQPNDFIAFYHIPKAGGMSLRETLRQEYIERHGCTEIKADIPEGVNISANGFYHKDGKFRCAYGHSACYAAFWTEEQECVYFTLLREPISRIISHYNFTRWSMEKHHLITEEHTMNQVFESKTFWDAWWREDNGFINYINWFPWVSNFYCRALSPYTHIVQLDQECMFSDGFADHPYARYANYKWANVGPLPSEEMYQHSYEAIENGFYEIKERQTTKAKRCRLVIGIMERLQESLDLFHFLFGWSTLHDAHHLNKTSNKTEVELSPLANKNLLEHNEYDIALYELAVKKFDRQLDEMKRSKQCQ